MIHRFANAEQGDYAEEGNMIIMNILAEESVNYKLALTKSIAND